MRLVQRHGRIDRIGSRHHHIYLRCFFPDRDLEALLRLEERLQRKLKQAAAAFGRAEVLPGHPRPAFRYVALDVALRMRTNDDHPDVAADLLTCLHQADPQRADVPADLPSDLRDAAFDAWAVAQRSIYQEWMRRTDPATFEPSVPKAMRDAADLVRRHGRRSGTPRIPWCGDSTKTSTYRSSGRSARSCEARAMTWPLPG